MNGYTLHPSASGLLIVAQHIPPPTLWLPAHVWPQLEQWRIESEGRQRQSAIPRHDEAAAYTMFARFARTIDPFGERAHLARMLQAGQLPPTHRHHDSSWDSTLDDINSLPETT